MRKKWLDRLFAAIQEDDPPYIEHLGGHWGDLCATTELASVWADQLLPTQRSVLRERKRGTYTFFSGTTLCYSALFKAGRRAEAFDPYAMLANQANSNRSTFRASPGTSMGPKLSVCVRVWSDCAVFTGSRCP